MGKRGEGRINFRVGPLDRGGVGIGRDEYAQCTFGYHDCLRLVGKVGWMK